MQYVTVLDCCEILDSQRKPITAKDRKFGEFPYYGANGIQDYVEDYIFDDELVLVAEDGGNFGSKTKPIAYRVSGKCWVNNHAHVLKPKNDINVDYLCYSLMFYDTSDLINGATRQKLTQSALRTMKIPNIPLDHQIKIVNKLNTIKNVKQLKESELNMLDNLIKSRFVEMFGDPEINPNNYPIKKLRDIAEYWNGLTYKPENVSNDGVIVLRSSNIQDSKLDFENIIRVTCKISEKKYVKKNDILMCSRNGSSRLVGKVALIDNITEPMSFGAFMMIIRSIYNPYLMIYFQLPIFKTKIATGATTTINQITSKMLDEIKIPVPKLEHIYQFSAFIEQVNKSKFIVDLIRTLMEMIDSNCFPN